MTAYLLARLFKNGSPANANVKFYSDQTKTNLLATFNTYFSGNVICSGGGGTYYVVASDNVDPSYKLEGWVTVNGGDTLNYGNLALIQSGGSVAANAGATSTITGWVIDSNGNPLPSLLVKITDIANSQQVYAQVNTNAQGAFSAQLNLQNDLMTKIQVVQKEIISGNADTRSVYKAITTKNGNIVVS